MPLIAALTPPEHSVSHTDEIVEPVRFDVADLVAITAPTPSAFHAYDLAREFRRRHVPVVIGGPHATALPEEAVRNADAVVVGEAEDTWPRVLEDAQRGKLESVYVSTGRAPLAGMPAPRWDLIKGRRYGKSVTIATRGCPHRCDYCSIPLLYGPGTVRYRPIDEVVREAARSSSSLRLAAVARRCSWVSNRFHRKASSRQTRRTTVSTTTAALSQTFIDMGSPSISGSCSGSITVGIFRRTADFLDEARVDVATISMVVPMPGTPTFRSLNADGRILTTDWSKYDGKKHCVFAPALMSPSEFEAGTEWVARCFYSPPSIARRLAVSQAGLWWNIPRNVGYMLAGLWNAGPSWDPAGCERGERDVSLTLQGS
jgi:radical SAM superfamily enzyme YgiQ (UPF0313 family)